MKLLTSILNVLLPQRCLLCLSSCPDQLCVPCRASLPVLGTACRRCALPLPSASANLCGRCLRKPPSFDASLAAFCYAAPVDKLISQFKNRGQLSAGRLLNHFLLQRIREHWEEGDPPELITAVPLHWSRQLIRGFNQSAFLAEYLSNHLGVPFTRLLRRRIATPKQQALSRRQRLRNLHKAFVADAAIVADRHIAVVDDVLTTGATAEAISRTLKHAGARRVQVWALARTPEPGSKG